jgi:hypothetical protein
MYAGVDFPTLLLDAFYGRPSPVTVTQTTDVAARLTFPSDAHHLLSLLGDAEVGRARKARAMLTFVGLALDPRIRSDLWFPGDRRLYLMSLHRFVRSLLKRFNPRRKRARAALPRPT